MPRLSVIVPTRDRAALLADCLVTLQTQSASHDALEVVVVDDGSEPDLSAVVASVDGPFELRCVRQSPAGLNAARMRGIAATTGDVVAFLDDDTLVEPEWAGAVMAAFEDPACAGLGGRVELSLEGPAPAWLSPDLRSYLSELDLGPEPRWLDGGVVPVGANCAARREVLSAVGGFRDGLDRSGRSLISSGDTELFRRIRAAGHRLRYDPRASVLHRVPAERLTLDFFRRRAFAQGVTDELIAADGGRSRARRTARELVRLGRAAPILLRGAVERRGAVHARVWTSYCRGRIATAARATTPLA